MQASKIATRETENKAAAFLDAKARSYAASTHYTEQERNQAERVRIGLSMVYDAEAIYVTYRKKFVAIKLENARVTNKRQLADLETYYANQGIEKVESPQGIIYRVPKLSVTV